MAAGLSSHATRGTFGSAAEHRFPQVPATAAAQPVPGRSQQEIALGESWTEDLRNLWPELPSAPDHALVESERAMRRWERDLSLDREQRGEF
jgi:hypothetical protein